MWHGQTVSIVLMTYAERMSIREVIDGLLGTGLVDEVVVVDNNAEDGTVAEVEQTDARLVFEPQQEGGYHVYAPELPGLHTQGDTLEEATESAREALTVSIWSRASAYLNGPARSLDPQLYVCKNPAYGRN